MLLLLISVALSQDCHQIEGHFCVNDQAVDLEQEPLETVLGQWRFETLIDESVLQNHLKGELSLGPGMGASGNSGYFNGEYYMSLDHKDEYENIVTISFWIFPLSSTSQFTTIFRKASKSTDYTPCLLLWPFTDVANVGGGQLEFIINTSYDRESVRSKGSLTGRKWNHVAIVMQGLGCQIYINGNQDAYLSLTARAIHNDGPFYIGGDPWFSGPLMYIDNLILYSEPFLQLEISKIATLPGQINQRLFYLGCDGCNYHQSINSCRFGYHLCSLNEITAGIYQYARQQGWLRLTKDIWTRVDEMDQQLAKNYLDPQRTKAAICCLDSFF